MSKQHSKEPYWVNNPTARRLWEAYCRMMEGEPRVVAKTARMTLSSVATEAGYQRSMLNRKRFPDLAELIDKNATKKPGKTMHALYQQTKTANRNLRSKLDNENKERGTLLNQLAALESRHLMMLGQLEKIKDRQGSQKVLPISKEDWPS